MSKRALLRILERERQAFAEERRQLIDVICHLAGKEWTPPPVPPPPLPDDDEEEQPVHDAGQEFEFAAHDFGGLE